MRRTSFSAYANQTILSKDLDIQVFKQLIIPLGDFYLWVLNLANLSVSTINRELMYV